MGDHNSAFSLDDLVVAANDDGETIRRQQQLKVEARMETVRMIQGGRPGDGMGFISADGSMDTDPNVMPMALSMPREAAANGHHGEVIAQFGNVGAHVHVAPAEVMCELPPSNGVGSLSMSLGKEGDEKDKPTKRQRKTTSKQPRWRSDEEAKLRGLISKMGTHGCWTEIAASLGSGRSAAAVQQHHEIMCGKRRSGKARLLAEGADAVSSALTDELQSDMRAIAGPSEVHSMSSNGSSKKSMRDSIRLSGLGSNSKVAPDPMYSAASNPYQRAVQGAGYVLPMASAVPYPQHAGAYGCDMNGAVGELNPAGFEPWGMPAAEAAESAFAMAASSGIDVMGHGHSQQHAVMVHPADQVYGGGVDMMGHPPSATHAPMPDSAFHMGGEQYSQGHEQVMSSNGPDVALEPSVLHAWGTGDYLQPHSVHDDGTSYYANLPPSLTMPDHDQRGNPCGLAEPCLTLHPALGLSSPRRRSSIES